MAHWKAIKVYSLLWGVAILDRDFVIEGVHMMEKVDISNCGTVESLFRKFPIIQFSKENSFEINRPLWKNIQFF